MSEYYHTSSDEEFCIVPNKQAVPPPPLTPPLTPPPTQTIHHKFVPGEILLYVIYVNDKVVDYCADETRCKKVSKDLINDKMLKNKYLCCSSSSSKEYEHQLYYHFTMFGKTVFKFNFCKIGYRAIRMLK